MCLLASSGSLGCWVSSCGLVPVDRRGILYVSTGEAFCLIMSAGFLALPALQASGKETTPAHVPQEDKVSPY